MFFGEYKPDIPDRDNDGLTVAKNTVPHLKSYKQMSDKVVASSALTSRPRGMIAVKDDSGNVYNYAGDENTLYSLVAGTYTSVNKFVTGAAGDITFTATTDIDSTLTDLSIFNDTETITVSGTTNNNTDFTINGTPTTTQIVVASGVTTESPAGAVTITRKLSQSSEEDHWEFARWNNQVLAVNGRSNDPVQAITIGGSYFDDLAGSPPKANRIAVVRDFVVLGNINDGADKTSTLAWSAIGDATGWTAGTNQSDTETLETGGEIQQIVGGEYGVIFSETSIRRMTYVGYPAVFQIDEVEPGRGTPAPKSVAKYGNTVFYLGRDGFYVFDGSVSTPIGTNRIDKTFYADLDQNYYYRVTSAIDPINTLVFWSYPGTGNVSGRPNKMVVYNWTSNRWAGPIEIEHQLIVQAMSQGATLDTLDTLNPAYTDLDNLPFSLDSRFYQGGSVILSCFDEDFKLANFTGSALDATFETGEFNLNPGGRSLITGIRPLFDGAGTATVALGTRNTVNGSTVWTANSSQNSQTGLCNFRSNAFYHRARMTVSGGFDHAYGFEPEFKAAGRK